MNRIFKTFALFLLVSTVSFVYAQDELDDTKKGGAGVKMDDGAKAGAGSLRCGDGCYTSDFRQRAPSDL